MVVIKRLLLSSIHHIHLRGVFVLVDGPRLHRAWRQETEDDATERVDSGGDEEHYLPGLASTLYSNRHIGTCFILMTRGTPHLDWSQIQLGIWWILWMQYGLGSSVIQIHWCIFVYKFLHSRKPHRQTDRRTSYQSITITCRTSCSKKPESYMGLKG